MKTDFMANKVIEIMNIRVEEIIEMTEVLASKIKEEEATNLPKSRKMCEGIKVTKKMMFH